MPVDLDRVGKSWNGDFELARPAIVGDGGRGDGGRRGWRWLAGGRTASGHRREAGNENSENW